MSVQTKKQQQTNKQTITHTNKHTETRTLLTVKHKNKVTKTELCKFVSRKMCNILEAGHIASAAVRSG